MPDRTPLDALLALLPAELDILIERLGVSPAILPGRQAPLATRAVELLHWARQQRREKELADLLQPRPSSPPAQTTTDRLLILTHPVHVPIGDDDIATVIPARGLANWDHIQVKPLEKPLGDEIDWPSVVSEQERIFTERVEPALKTHTHVGYFGVSPIPLALHLGYRVTNAYSFSLYHRYQEGGRWSWRLTPSRESPTFEPSLLPSQPSNVAGPVVIRVSTSRRIDPESTRRLVPGSLAEIDIALKDPEAGTLESDGAVEEIARRFRQALDRAVELFPNVDEIHLFAAVRNGIAFRLGTEISATQHPPIVTYQYLRSGPEPHHRPAIRLQGGRGHAITSNAPPNAPSSPLATSSQLPTPLPHDVILEIHQNITSLPIDRDVLLEGIPPTLLVLLTNASNPSGQLLRDLSRLNQMWSAESPEPPLVTWLKNAANQSRGLPEASYFRGLIERLRR